MDNQAPFKPQDLVAVFGGEVGKEGKSADQVTICRILAVGETDLVVEEATGRYSRLGTYIVPAGLCVSLKMNPSNLTTEKILSPQLGDLVLSHTKENFKNDPPVQITGILYKIAYKLGRPYTYTLISGEEMKEVSADSVVVLQQKAQD
jgi:hypothetical protein